jgi:hypothetical protein
MNPRETLSPLRLREHIAGHGQAFVELVPLVAEGLVDPDVAINAISCLADNTRILVAMTKPEGAA